MGKERRYDLMPSLTSIASKAGMRFVELVPGLVFQPDTRTSLTSYYTLYLVFGMGGVGATVLGWIADQTSIGFVYKVCSFLPLIGLLTALLPDLWRTEYRRAP